MEIFRTARRTLIWLSALALTVAATAAACAAELVPVGEIVGIELKTDGVLVAALAGVDGGGGEVYPAADAGLEPGDLIVSLGGREIHTAEDFVNAAALLCGEATELKAVRKGETVTFTVTPAEDSDGAYRLGLFLRDGVTGVGTVTFYDPDTGVYGALGHGVTDSDTGVLLPVGSGVVCEATVADARRGERDAPGELQGVFDAADPTGSILLNTPSGIFGVLAEAPEGETLITAASEEIKTGAATIISQVRGDAAEEFDVEIDRVYCGGEEKLVVTVTDPELIELTGGIVQGMSGSPIIQNGKLVGAVTHVLLSDPTRGYGVTIDRMLSAAVSAG